MIEVIRASTEKVQTNYPGLVVNVFDMSLFYPRGSMGKPKELLNNNSVDQIVKSVLEVNPASRIKDDAMHISRYSQSHQDSEYQDMLNTSSSEIVYPEAIIPGLNLNCLREIFKNRGSKPGNDFSHGDRIAIIRPLYGNHPFTLLVDLSKCEYAPFDNSSDIREEVLKPFSNESAQPLKEKIKPKKAVLTEKPKRNFNEIDLVDSSLVAKDEGKRKDYPKETQNFFNRMNLADLAVENMLINSMNIVVPVSDVIHRLERKCGREKVREMLMSLRNKGLDGNEELFLELKSDIDYATLLTSKPSTVEINEIKKGLELMFRSEKEYMEAIIDFPWNKIGPEPFDALINVFWFRFDFRTLQDSWKQRILDFKALKSKFYGKAQSNRILRWVYKTQDLSASSLKDLNELGISYNIKEVDKIMGPVGNFFNKDEFNEEVKWLQKESRPSGLTLLLWKTLKWASPSEGTNSNLFSDMRYIDPELWDEKFPDPRWVEMGDLQGRLTLPGESMKKPMSHLKSNKSSRLGQMEKEIAWDLEDRGDEISLAEAVQLAQRKLRQKILKGYESSASGFSKAVSSLSLCELKEKIDKLPNLHKAVALHRLGYDINGGCGDFAFHADEYTVRDVTGSLFRGSSYRYYGALREITKKFTEK